MCPNTSVRDQVADAKVSPTFEGCKHRFLALNDGRGVMFDKIADERAKGSHTIGEPNKARVV